MPDDDTTLTDPAAERSGATVDDAVATAEEGTQVEGAHTPSGQAESGDSRAEHMADEPVTPDDQDDLPVSRARTEP